MKKHMNALLIIAGIALLVAGIVRGWPKTPQDGALEIRSDGTGFWVYKYVETPGWRIEKFATTLDEARAFKAKHEKTPRTPEQVVE